MKSNCCFRVKYTCIALVNIFSLNMRFFLKFFSLSLFDNQFFSSCLNKLDCFISFSPYDQNCFLLVLLTKVFTTSVYSLFLCSDTIPTN